MRLLFIPINSYIQVEISDEDFYLGGTIYVQRKNTALSGEK